MHLFGDNGMARADFLENRDNIDCRHIGHLTPLMVQAMEMGQGSNSKRQLCLNLPCTFHPLLLRPSLHE